jgi:CheY-like chemotaxis protein
MDEPTRSRAFEPFFTTKRLGKGTGLGLSTVYAVVRQNGGEVRIDSHPGEGCRIEIDLPRARQEPAKTAARRATGSSARRDRCATVLLVEDDPTFLAMLTEFLEERGCTVLSAPGPLRALELLEAHDGEVDLAVTDMVMPEMSGRELAERLAALTPEIRLVLMSGYSDDDLHPEELDRRGIEFLKKPFGTADLLAAIDRLLDAAAPGGGSAADLTESPPAG